MNQRPSGSRDDWFRSSKWDSEAEALFEAKLRRARSGRAQYLRIKGLALTSTSDQHKNHAGRELLRRVINEYPEDGGQVSGAHYAIGDSYAKAGRYAEAEEHLRACLALEPTVHHFHDTELRLAEALIAARAVTELDEAQRLLDAATTHRSPFPVTAWRIEIARARLCDLEGDRAAASTHARAALAMLDNNAAPFVRHPTVGLIEPDRQTVHELKQLAQL